MFPGLPERLLKELKRLAPADTKINVLAPADRSTSVWRGGSRLAASPEFRQMCITKGEYGEVGPSISLTKCPM